MVIAIGSDHAGLALKSFLISVFKDEYEFIDVGTYTNESCDYPDYAHKVCKLVEEEKASFGILICYTGIGMSMAANHHAKIRAGLVQSVENAHLTREHNNANVLCLGAKDVGEKLAVAIVKEFLNTEFAGGRHERRVNKI